jgi:uracil-DNA glycosylase
MADLTLDPSWNRRLCRHPALTGLKSVGQFLRQEMAAGKHIYPPSGMIFNAFTLTPFETVKVVILGQDPYHGPEQAHGLSFSVDGTTPPPPSLCNIFKERQNDLGLPFPAHGNLAAWAKQGVLLLNACLTVERGHAGSHQKKGWEPFTDAVMESVTDSHENIVFILWGKKAQEKGRFIDQNKHLVIASVHPSPLSAYRGFFGSKPFSRTNTYLTKQGKTPVDWGL